MIQPPEELAHLLRRDAELLSGYGGFSEGGISSFGIGEVVALDVPVVQHVTAMVCSWNL